MAPKTNNHNKIDLESFDNAQIKSQLEEVSQEPLEPVEELETSRGLDDSVQLYLKAIGRIPLLSVDEEIQVARQIASDNPFISKKASNKLVQANLRLVVAIAKRYSTHSVPLLDLIQEGNTGLMKAAQKFDSELGYRFSTYATWWIKQAITRSISEKERSIRIPTHALEQINKLKKVVNQFTKEYGRAPTDAEVASSLDFSTTDVNLWKEIDTETISLEAPLNKDNEGSLSEIISDLEEKTPEYELQKKSLRQDLLKLLNELEEEERKILELRFGFNQGERFHSIEEVSAICNISRDKVRKVEFKALRKLKNLMGNELKDYLFG
jgi:RNA polymerase primary sigma factor